MQENGQKKLIDKLTDLLSPTIEGMGFEIVRIRLTGDMASPTLQIMAERPEDGMLGIEDCEEISHAVSAVLDVEDPISGQYTLEVSSPGIARPLTRFKDFERYEGLEAKIEIDPALEDGRKRFKGRLAGVKGDDVLIDTDTGVFGLHFADIRKAQLVMNDELLAAAEAAG